MTDGSLVVTLADPLGNGTMLNYTADPEYYVTVTGRNSAHNYVPKNVDKGYSPGKTPNQSTSIFSFLNS